MEVFNKRVGTKDAYLRVFLHRKFESDEAMKYEEKRRAMLIIPGGGYIRVSEREAEPIALKYFAQGFECAVLFYSTGDDIKTSSPIKEAEEALLFLKSLESVDENRVSAIGFSAGAHLAAMLASHGHECGDNANIKSLILSYPVISMGEYAHIGSRENIIKERNEDISFFSAEMCVTPSFPPTFIWSTRDDASVNIRNSILMYEALIDNNVYSELHIYPEGVHGLSTATIESGIINKYVSSWFDETLKFMDSI